MNFLTYSAILLRSPEPSDLNLLFDAENDVDVWPDSDAHAPLSRDALSRYIASYAADPFGEGQLRMIAVDRPSGCPVGILDLYDISPIHRRAFVGIYIFPEHRRKGYATKILEAAEQYARRRLNIQTLAARILATNLPSLRLFTSAGFTHAATIPQWHFANGQFHDQTLLIKSLRPTRTP